MRKTTMKMAALGAIFAGLLALAGCESPVVEGPKMCTVTFHPNLPQGAQDAPEAKKYEYEENSEQVIPALFTRDGHDLAGWADTADAGAAKYTVGQTYTVASDMNLYAVWKAKAAQKPGDTPQGGNEDAQKPGDTAQSGQDSQKPSSPNQSDATQDSADENKGTAGENKGDAPQGGQDTQNPSAPNQGGTEQGGQKPGDTTQGGNGENTGTTGENKGDATQGGNEGEQNPDDIPQVPAAPAQGDIGYDPNEWEIQSCRVMKYKGLKHNIIIPDGVTRIGAGAFAGFSALESITFPTGITHIETLAFSECTGFTSMTIPHSVTDIGTYAFSGCTGLTSMTIPNRVTAIKDYTFYSCTGLQSVEMPSINYIGTRAFYNCTRLKDVTIPSSVTTIEAEAFSGCYSLTSIEIPSSVTAIGQGAFSNTSLDSVTIPEGVVIFNNAFQNCKSLTKITFKGTMSQWKAISKGSSWDANTGIYTVICTDGTLDNSGNVVQNPS